MTRLALKKNETNLMISFVIPRALREYRKPDSVEDTVNIEIDRDNGRIVMYDRPGRLEPKENEHIFSWFDFYEEVPIVENECDFVDVIFESLLFIKGAAYALDERTGTKRFPCYEGLIEALFERQNWRAIREKIMELWGTEEPNGPMSTIRYMVIECRMDQRIKKWKRILVERDEMEDPNYIAGVMNLKYQH